jgi:hypothetical protein
MQQPPQPPFEKKVFRFTPTPLARKLAQAIRIISGAEVANLMKSDPAPDQSEVRLTAYFVTLWFEYQKCPVYTPAMLSAMNDRLDILQAVLLLTEERLQYNVCKRIFLDAAVNGHLQVLQFFADNGFDVNTTYVTGGTALYAAINSEHLESVQFLLSHNAHPNIIDQTGSTALDVAYNRLETYLADFAIDPASRSRTEAIIALLKRHGGTRAINTVPAQREASPSVLQFPQDAVITNAYGYLLGKTNPSTTQTDKFT